MLERQHDRWEVEMRQLKVDDAMKQPNPRTELETVEEGWDLIFQRS